MFQVGYEASPAGSTQEGQHRDLFQTVVSRNGPLPDHHPQMLLQCLLWGRLFWLYIYPITNHSIEKIELVKQIIIRLAKGLKYLTPEERATFELPPLPVEAFLEDDPFSNQVSLSVHFMEGIFDSDYRNPANPSIQKDMLYYLMTLRNRMFHSCIVVFTECCF